ncbi:Uncharacterized protein PBTT_05125 [Plasmodiophora brassicae]
MPSLSFVISALALLGVAALADSTNGGVYSSAPATAPTPASTYSAAPVVVPRPTAQPTMYTASSPAPSPRTATTTLYAKPTPKPSIYTAPPTTECEKPVVEEDSCPIRKIRTKTTSYKGIAPAPTQAYTAPAGTTAPAQQYNAGASAPAGGAPAQAGGANGGTNQAIAAGIASNSSANGWFDMNASPTGRPSTVLVGVGVLAAAAVFL